MDDTASEDVVGLLEALAKLDPGPIGPEVADALGTTLEALWPVLAGAIEGGWVERWDLHDTTHYLLSQTVDTLCN